MAAVLSLGVVGYGVATTFLLFGAPGPRHDAVLGRDAHGRSSTCSCSGTSEISARSHHGSSATATPALLPGSARSLAALVLSVSTTETAPRLREYFVEFGPTLGHGRNIVNVILVDFRGVRHDGRDHRARDRRDRCPRAASAGGRRAGPTWNRAREPPLTSPIFRTAARLLMPLLLLFAVFLLLRGHNEPGGGFVGGLVAAAAFALYAIAYGVERARQALLVKPLTLLGAGLLIALASGVPAALRGQPFMTAQWALGPVALGTPALFDIGVFLVVAGVVLMMIFSLAEES